MREDVQLLVERITDFAAEVILLVDRLPNTLAGRHIGGQLIRSGTSVAANYEEGCAAESRADFIHKLLLSLKEARESRLWLKLLVRTILKTKPDGAALLKEAEELCNILAASVVTAKANMRGTRQPPA